MKKIHTLIIIFVLLMTTSCETRIPEVDSTLPTFSFEIRGDGLSHKFTQDDDFSRMQLNLRANTEYRFTYTAADQGGVGLIQWQLGGDNRIDFTRPEFPFDSWIIRDIPPLSRMIEWTGNRSNPRTGGVITGIFRTGNLQSSLSTWRFFVRDFGGQSGTPNSVRGNLNVLIGDSETELILF